MKNKKILVLGGNGFIGKNILIELIKNKKNKIFASLFKNKKGKLKNIKYYNVDLRNYKNCVKITKGKNIVFICAATSSGASDLEKNPLIHFKDNLLINLNVLDASTKNNVRKIIFISSNTVYPPSKNTVGEKDINYKLFSKYFVVGWMKLFSEISSEIFSKYKNTQSKVLIVRPGNLYGPNDKFQDHKSKVIPSLIKKFSNHKLYNKDIEIWGNGKDIKDFMFIKDFVTNLIRISFKFKENDIINLASGKSVSLKKIINILKKKLKVNNNSIRFNKSRPTMIPVRKISMHKVKRNYGLKINYKLEDGLVHTIKWYKKNVIKQNTI
tara:strand:- start:46808 stop:47782 length:975 start_codon:yes stop_codon:yes gene_type:complete